MAFSAALRRATADAAPLAARSVKATAMPQNHRSSLLRTLPLRNILPLARLSSLSAKHHSDTGAGDDADADADLLKILDSEIKIATGDYRKPEKFPRGFPFEIEDEKGMNVITLRSRHPNEEIEVVVSMPTMDVEEENDEDDENNDIDEGEDDRTVNFSIPLTVNIRKRGGASLEFGCIAYPEGIEIDALSYKRDEDSEGAMVPYEGPPYNQLDDSLQNALQKYLEKRGISPITTNLLYEYMINKDNREYLVWLKNLRHFIGGR